MVVHNPVLQHVVDAWTQPTIGLYTPLAYTLWSGVASITMSPAAFHLVNVLLHAACVLLVFDVLLRLPLPGGPRAGVRGETSADERGASANLPPRADAERNAPPDVRRFPPHLTSPLRGEGRMLLLPAVLGAAIFAVHPLQVEAVAWISGMNNLLAGLFSLACIRFFVRFASRRAKIWYALSLAAFLLALLSKPTAIVTPLVIVAIDLWLLRRTIRQTFIAVLPMVAIAVPFVIIGRRAQPMTDMVIPPLLQRLIVAGDALGFYLNKLVWPWPLLMDYSRTPERVLATGGSIAGWIAVMTLLLILVLNRRRPWVLGCVGIFIAGFSIVSGIVPFGFQHHSTVADRYVYLAMLGPSLAVAILLTQWHFRARWLITGIVIAILSIVSVVQSDLWRDTITLCDHTISHNDRTVAIRAVAGVAYRNAGRPDLAEAMYLAALKVRPNDPVIHYDYGNLLLPTRPEAALAHYNAAIAGGYETPALLLNLGQALYRTGQVDAAVDVFRSVLRMSPADVSANVNLGYCLATRGEFDAADACFRRALESDPNSELAKRGLAKLAAVRAGPSK